MNSYMLAQSGPESNGNEDVFRILQIAEVK